MTPLVSNLGQSEFSISEDFFCRLITTWCCTRTPSDQKAQDRRIGVSYILQIVEHKSSCMIACSRGRKLRETRFIEKAPHNHAQKEILNPSPECHADFPAAIQRRSTKMITLISEADAAKALLLTAKELAATRRAGLISYVQVSTRKFAYLPAHLEQFLKSRERSAVLHFDNALTAVNDNGPGEDPMPVASTARTRRTADREGLVDQALTKALLEE